MMYPIRIQEKVITRMLPELRPELLTEVDEDAGHAYLECKTAAYLFEMILALIGSTSPSCDLSRLRVTAK